MVNLEHKAYNFRNITEYIYINIQGIAKKSDTFVVKLACGLIEYLIQF